MWLTGQDDADICVILGPRNVHALWYMLGTAGKRCYFFDPIKIKKQNSFSPIDVANWTSRRGHFRNLGSP